MQAEKLQELLDYDPLSGRVVIKSSGKLLFPAEDGYCLLTLPDGKKKKIKLNKICYSLLHNKTLLKTCKVIHRDLDTSNFRANNLILLTAPQYKELKEALKNLQGGIRLQVHPTDVYSYKLFWYEDAKEKTKVVQDIVVAKRLEQRLLLKSSKILTKYCSVD